MSRAEWTIDAIDWSRFTDAEVSGMLSALANEQPLCCERGRYIRNAIIRDQVKRDQLAWFAYEYLGCGSTNSERWEYWFDRLVEHLSAAPARQVMRTHPHQL